MTATFTLRHKVGSRLFVAGENREIVLKGNTFVDTFAPRETHIYINNQEDANAVPAVAETVKTIEDFRQARRKDGNLIAVGEMKEADYLEYGAGKIPAGVPTLQASSDARYYATKTFGSLYFLVDGIVEPLRVEMSWSPRVSDQVPWLDITCLNRLRFAKSCLHSGWQLVAGKWSPTESHSLPKQRPRRHHCRAGRRHCPRPPLRSQSKDKPGRRQTR